MKWWLLCWLVQSVVCQESNTAGGQMRGVSTLMALMEEVNSTLIDGDFNKSTEAVEKLENALEETELMETTPISVDNFIAVLHKHKGPFKGLHLYASNAKAMSEKAVANSTVSVHLPSELGIGSDNTVVFCMITWPKKDGVIWRSPGKVYENRLVGVSVRAKNVLELRERVNITMNLTTGIKETENVRCAFFNFSTKEYSEYGCQTLWEHGQSHITCSCNHLTYFAVLLVSAPISPSDEKALSYITLIGCSISLFSLVITVVLFFTKRKARADISMKVHINLAIALIFLNLHFLFSETVAALSSNGFCFYMALGLHFSLLATFSWMAVEGFHLYLLLVRVFNIYVRRYLLKLSLVGWGIPAVIVTLVVIIKRDVYGRVPLNTSNPNSTICFMGKADVKMITTVGVYSLVFVFNLIMLGVTVRRVVSLRQHKEAGQSHHDRVKRDICTLLGVSVLLGITWGLIFFSFGDLTTPSLYLFSILNSLQGFFIFLWFMMSLRKTENSATQTSGDTRSTHS